LQHIDLSPFSTFGITAGKLLLLRRERERQRVRKGGSKQSSKREKGRRKGKK
jgi:hypothetical protein